jgi:DNA-binding XRE family transcriptional regulator
MTTEMLETPVKKARDLRRMGQIEAAKAAGVSQSYWGSVERGESVPTLAVARRIAKALGFTLDELWPDESVKKSRRRAVIAPESAGGSRSSAA